MSRENEICVVEECPAGFEEIKLKPEQPHSFVTDNRKASAVINKSKRAIKITKSGQGKAHKSFDSSENKDRESKDRLRHSQKMEALGTLTGGIAHDFNNLLTAIIGNTQLALSRIESDDALRHRLSEVEKAANRAAVLTRQLLAFSRRQHLDRRAINLNETVSEIAKLLQRIIGEDIEVSIIYGFHLSKVFADRAQIEQVLMNLCVNAREAMPDGGTMTIETSDVALDEKFCRRHTSLEPGKYVQISVTDNGKGMDEETKARIFDPFFTTKEVGDGAGLGLSMAYGIVEQHGGRIEIESEKGRGTRVSIFLPADKTVIAAEEQIVQLSLFRGNETILVAEDEEALRNLVKDVLGKIGYTVLLAKNGEEAVAIYTQNSNQIDMLLFDVVMPRMSGVEAYRQIKYSGGEDLPVIFMTGYSSETIQNQFITKDNRLEKLGAAVIQKPYNVSELGYKIRGVLDSRLKKRRFGKKQRAAVCQNS